MLVPWTDDSIANSMIRFVLNGKLVANDKETIFFRPIFHIHAVDHLFLDDRHE